MQEHTNNTANVPDKKVVFVDMGETLVSFDPKFWQPLYWTLKDLGYYVSEKEVYRSVMKLLGKDHFPSPYIAGLSKIDLRDLLVELNIVPRAELIELLEREKLLADKWSLFEDAEEFLKAKKRDGYDIVMITNSTPDLPQIIKDLSLDNYLTGVVASYEVGIMKPHPRIFRIAIEKYGRPEYHVGDVYEIDVVGAMRAGIRGVLLDRWGFYDDLKYEHKVKNLLELL